jgi:hypothetical protein
MGFIVMNKKDLPPKPKLIALVFVFKKIILMK